MKSPILISSLVALVFPLSWAEADEKPPPPVEAIMEGVRFSVGRGDESFSGTLENRAKRTKESFRLRKVDDVMRFDFLGDPPMALQLDLGEDAPILREQIGGKVSRVPAERLGENVRGTDLNYEDLSMRFLYWDGARLEGEGSVKNQRCWIILLPGPDGPYRWVRIWVEKKGLAVMKMNAFDHKNNKVKAYEVTNVRNVGGKWMLKGMKIESFAPGARGPVGLSFLELSKPLRIGGGR